MTDTSLAAVARALSLLRGQAVTVTIADALAGWVFVSIDGTLTSLEVADDRLLTTLDDGRATVGLVEDMIDSVAAANGEVRIAYRAGNVTVVSHDVRPAAGQHLRSLRS